MPQWVISDYKRHTCDTTVAASTTKPGHEERKTGLKYRTFSVTPLEKPMLAPALVSPCIMNRALKPKDAKAILKKHVVRELPKPFVSATLKIAKEIAASGVSTSQEYLSKLQGHAQLLRELGHHCTVEVTDYEGMVQVTKYGPMNE